MSYPNLLSPTSLPLPLKNRVALAPMTRGRASPSNNPTALTATYYASRAKAGLLITEGASISIQARGWFRAPDIFTSENAESWRKVTDAVHAADGKIFCQLWHSGRASHSSFRTTLADFQGDPRPVAPSALKRDSASGVQMYTPLEKDPEIETPRELTVGEIGEIVRDFGNAARVAKEAGFDGVELHAANGYLLDEFLQSVSNVREDDYGGSLENRFRILGEVLNEVLKVFAAERVSVRISPNGSFNGMGSDDFREAFLYYASRLRELNIGILHICIGLGFGFHEKGEAMVLEEFRKVFPGVIMGNVGYTAESGDKAIEDGVADLISFGRPFLGNADLVERFEKKERLREMPDHTLLYSSVANVRGAEGYTEV